MFLLEDAGHIYEVYENTIIKLNLLSESVKCSEIKDEIEFWNTFYKLYNTIINKYSKKILSTHEVRLFIRKETTDQELCDKIVNELISNKILDDERYKHSYIDSYIENLKYGSNKIISKLDEIGINLTDEEIFRIRNLDCTKCEKIVAKEVSKNTSKSNYELKSNIYNKLSSYLYPKEVIESVIYSVKIDDNEMLKRSCKKLSKVYSKEKVIKRLMNKGYKYENIMEVIDE